MPFHQFSCPNQPKALLRSSACFFVWKEHEGHLQNKTDSLAGLTMCLALLSLTQNSKDGLTFIQGRWQLTRSHSPLVRPPTGTPEISGGTRGGSEGIINIITDHEPNDLKRWKLLLRVSTGIAAVTIFWPCVPEERRDENCSGQQNFRDHSGSGYLIILAQYNSLFWLLSRLGWLKRYLHQNGLHASILCMGSRFWRMLCPCLQ